MGGMHDDLDAGNAGMREERLGGTPEQAFIAKHLVLLGRVAPRTAGFTGGDNESYGGFGHNYIEFFTVIDYDTQQ
jgi:hypothetical protein